MTIDRALRVLDVYASVNGSGQCTQDEFEEAKKMAIEALKGKDANAPSRKGVFIPDITVEMFRNASLEGVEDFMTSGEMEDISLPSVQPEQRWIPCSERLPEGNMWTICQNNAGAMMIGKYDICFGWMFPAYFDGIVAWMPLPELYREETE